jgi:hypothetical protein
MNSSEVLMPDAKSASVLDLVNAGVAAFRDRNFPEAQRSLQAVLDIEPEHWRAKLYLAMSFYQAGEVFTAYRHFLFLRDNCPDTEIRSKSEVAMQAMNSQVQVRTSGNATGMPEMTCTMKKPTLPPPPAQVDDGSDIEWVDESAKGKAWQK